MGILNIQDFLNKLTIGTKVDKDCEFLKGYDKNSNSIFDADEIESLKQDFQSADKQDGEVNNLSEKDLLAFYNNAMKKLNPNFKEVQSLNITEQVQDWIELISSGKASAYAEMKEHERYQKLSAEQQVYAKEFLLSGELGEEFFFQDAIELAEIATPKNKSRIKELLTTKINDTNILALQIQDILEYSIEEQNRAIEIVKTNNLPINRIPGVLKLVSIERYLPEDFFAKNPDFCVVGALDDAIGYKTDYNATESYLYKPDKGLVEVKNENPETGQTIVRNLEHNIIQKIQFGEVADEKKFVIQENINKYDRLEFDTRTNTWKTGNLIETRSLSRNDNEDIPTIVVTDANGTERVLQKAELKDGTLSVVKNFTSSEGTTTKVNYQESSDGITTMSYRITDKDGNVIMNKEQSIKQISENKFITTVDGKEYEAVFTGTRLFITDKANNKTKTFNLNKEFISEGKGFILEILEQVPANLLMAMDKLPIKSISLDVDNSSSYANNARWSEKGRYIELGQYEEIKSDIDNKKEEKVADYLLSVFIHEYGHYLDSDINTGNCDEISTNPELLRIYQKEKEAFAKNTTSQQQEYISYFTNNHDEKRDSQECVAEATMLLNTIPGKSVSTRAAYYQENFPRTIAKINELLNARLTELNQ